MHDRTPGATYRLQLGERLSFADAAELVDYLTDLGITHLYLSPLLQPRPGSTHGYDVADPTRVSEPLGGEQGLRALAERAHRRGLGLVADIVPNHLGTGPATPLWDRLLADGQSGEGGRFFDVDWDPPLPTASGKVLLPVLGDQYGVVLERGELEVAVVDGEPRLRYFERTFPLSAESSEALGRVGGPEALRGRPGEPSTWTRLHALLEAQHYRLMHWRAGDGLVNYRRFFAINDLAAVRVEDPAVFDATHQRILALVADGVIDGLRVDHPDGLADPSGYLDVLAARTGSAWIVVEKILAVGERLPEDWPVAGTTGYEFCNDAVGLFVDPAARPALDASARAFEATPDDEAAALRRAKAEVLSADLAADARRVALRLWTVAQHHREIRDVDDRACLQVVTRAIQALDVYRTYVDPFTGDARPEDVALIEDMIAAAEALPLDAPAAPPGLYRLLADVLGGRAGTDPAHLEVIRRFQQLSSAAMAKGAEDTYFYRQRRLLAVNEVGGEPARLGIDAGEFHASSRARAETHPTSLLTTATHDTKRGEDTRLRIAALSEMAGGWDAAVRGWRERNRALRSPTPAGPAPDPATEYLLYQTLVGVWPPSGAPDAALAARVRGYAVKASREAKERTNWLDPNEAFEDGIAAFVAALLDPDTSGEFLTQFGELAEAAAEIAMVSGLAQTLLRCTAPGVPDTYQGTELWDDSLVDPDNRRPVDFALRRRLLGELDAPGTEPAELLAGRRDGRVKLWVLSRALRARAAHPGCVGRHSGYEPLRVSGRWADHIVAFARPAPGGADCLVTVVPRLPGAVMAGRGRPPLGEDWSGTAVTLPVGEWTDLLTGAGRAGGSDVPVGDVLRTLPVALLARP